MSTATTTASASPSTESHSVDWKGLVTCPPTPPSAATRFSSHLPSELDPALFLSHPYLPTLQLDLVNDEVTNAMLAHSRPQPDMDAYRARAQAYASLVAENLNTIEMARKTLGISPTTLATASLYPSYASNEPITPSPSYTSSPTLPYSHLGHATGLTPSTTRPESSIKVSTTRASMPPPPSDATVGVRRKSMSSVLDSLHYTKRVKRSVSPEPMCHPPALQKEIQVPIDEILQEERRLCGQAAKPPAPCVRWTTDASGKKKKARHLTTPFQTRVLRQVLAYTAFPSTEQRAHLAMEMGMTPRGVQIWFQNQRQKAKARQLAQMHMSKAAHRAMHRPLRSASAGPTHFPYREDDSDLLSIPEWGQPPYSLHESDEMSPTSSNSPDSFSLPHSPLNTPSEYDDEEGIDASMPLHHPPETSGRPDAPTLPPTPMYAEHSYSPTQYHTTSVKHGHLATPHYAYTIRQSHKEVKVLPRQPLANVLTGSSGVMGLGVEASDRSGGEGLNSSEWPQQWP